MVKAVIFDVDDVVIRSRDGKGKYLWSRNAKEDLGLDKSHFQKIYQNAS